MAGGVILKRYSELRIWGLSLFFPILNTYDYTAFGEILSQTETIPNRYKFTGREWNAESQSYYYRARQYNPYVGRFTRRDPIGYTAGINLYAYVSNNPPNFTDAYGLICLAAEKRYCKIERVAILIEKAKAKPMLVYQGITKWEIAKKIEFTAFVVPGSDPTCCKVLQFVKGRWASYTTPEGIPVFEWPYGPEYIWHIDPKKKESDDWPYWPSEEKSPTQGVKYWSNAIQWADLPGLEISEIELPAGIGTAFVTRILDECSCPEEEKVEIAEGARVPSLAYMRAEIAWNLRLDLKLGPQGSLLINAATEKIQIESNRTYDP